MNQSPGVRFPDPGGVTGTCASYPLPLPKSSKFPAHIAGCPRALTLVCYNLLEQETRLVPIRCKCWSCPFCRVANKKILMARILAGQPDKFITLTTKAQEGETPPDVYKRCRPAIGRLLAKLRKAYGDIQCAIILELTKKGFPHWHLCCRGPWIPQAVISAEWEKLTGAKVVDIRKIYGPKDAAIYATKYVAKTAGNPATRALGRIISFSHQYSLIHWSPHRPGRWEYTRERDHPIDIMEAWPSGWSAYFEDGAWVLRPCSLEVAAEDVAERRQRNRQWMDESWRSSKLRIQDEPPPAVAI